MFFLDDCAQYILLICGFPVVGFLLRAQSSELRGCLKEATNSGFNRSEEMGNEERGAESAKASKESKANAGGRSGP